MNVKFVAAKDVKVKKGTVGLAIAQHCRSKSRRYIIVWCVNKENCKWECVDSCAGISFHEKSTDHWEVLFFGKLADVDTTILKESEHAFAIESAQMDVLKEDWGLIEKIQKVFYKKYPDAKIHGRFRKYELICYANDKEIYAAGKNQTEMWTNADKRLGEEMALERVYGPPRTLDSFKR